MKVSLQLLLLSMAQVICANVLAADKPRVAADNAEAFAQTAQAVRTDMNAGGRYEFINASDRAKVEADLDTMSAMLHKAPSVSALSQPDQVALFNTQEHLNGILTHSDKTRLVCERRAPVGTNIPLTSCKTVGEIEKMRRDSEKYMNDHSRDANINSAAINRTAGDNASGHH